jgi:hypothetical protein
MFCRPYAAAEGFNPLSSRGLKRHGYQHGIATRFAQAGCGPRLSSGSICLIYGNCCFKRRNSDSPAGPTVQKLVRTLLVIMQPLAVQLVVLKFVFCSNVLLPTLGQWIVRLPRPSLTIERFGGGTAFR